MITRSFRLGEAVWQGKDPQAEPPPGDNITRKGTKLGNESFQDEERIAVGDSPGPLPLRMDVLFHGVRV
ncbi:hypothetical protein GCM10023155_44500 [Bremerella cremea]